MGSSSPRQDRLVVVAGLVWLGPGRLLVQRRPSDARHGANLLELPGGKVERGEAPRDALRRELCEEWGAGTDVLRIGAVADALHHVYPEPGPEVLLLVHHVDARAWGSGWAAMIVPEAGLAPAEYAAAELPVEEFLAADQGLMTRVRDGLVVALR